ncbi:hypothetical protein KIPB_009901, partial [Kipferlia bialata]|eukprot:g9901.t1
MPPQFRCIAVPDPNPALCQYASRLAPYSGQAITFHDTQPKDTTEFVSRCQGADCVLIGWASTMSRATLESLPDLRYIGLACTLFPGACNVDLTCARERGVSVRGVGDYGDVGVVEFVAMQCILHCQRHSPPTELRGRRVGVVGAGQLGTKV